MTPAYLNIMPAVTLATSMTPSLGRNSLADSVDRPVVSIQLLVARRVLSRVPRGVDRRPLYRILHTIRRLVRLREYLTTPAPVRIEEGVRGAVCAIDLVVARAPHQWVTS